MKLIKKISAILLGVSLFAGGIAVTSKKSMSEVSAKNVTSTLTFTGKCEGSGTASDGVTWTVASDSAESTYDGTKGIHYGTGSAAVSYLTLTSASFSDTVSKVVVNCSDANKTANITVKVGTTDFLCNGETSVVEASYNNSAYTFTGSATGSVVVSMSRSSAKKALYVKSIAVTYDDGEAIINVEDVAISEASLTVFVGASSQLEATVSPNDASDKSVTWSSDDETIATVDENGVVEGVAIGKTTIRVLTTDGEYEDYCEVTVQENPYKVDKLNKTTLSLGSNYTKYQNKSLISSAEYFLFVSTNGNNIQSNKNNDAAKHYGIVTTKTGGLAKSVTVTFADNNTNSYDIYGSNTAYTDPDNLYGSDTKGTLIESISQSKTVVISDNYQYLGFYSPSGANYIAEIKIEWEPVKPTSISLAAENSTTVSVGKAENIIPTFTNSNSLIVSEEGLSWSSSDTSVATVSNGVVTGVAAGNVTITATSEADNNVKNTIDLVVSAEIVHVESVSLNESILNLVDEEKVELIATISPDNAYDQSVSWESDDESVATVDSDGVVTGVSEGTATITVTTTDGEKTATCDVTVTMRPRVSYELVTADSQLIVGAKYIVVGVKSEAYFAMGHYESGNNIKPVEIPSPTDNVFTDVEAKLDDCAYVLGGESGAYTFYDGANYIYAAGAATSGNNYLKAKSSVSETSKFDVSIDSSSSEATICSIDETTINKLLRFNGGSSLFSCYLDATKQSAVYLYRVVPKADTAEGFATIFLDQTGAICATAGSHATALEEIWDDLSSSYSSLEATEKAALVSASASALVKAAIARYDYLVSAYELTEFIQDHVVSGFRSNYISAKTNNNTAITVVIIVSLVSVTSLGVLITLKKRKTISK